MGKCLNMPKFWVQSWGVLTLAPMFKIVPKIVGWNDSLKKPGLFILATCMEQIIINATIFTLIWILLFYKNSSEKLQQLILKF